jgi:5-formyltetrahydrofolate cyclo-ligase
MALYTKEYLRKSIIQKRDAVDTKTRNEWDKGIFKRFINSEFYKNSHVLFIFVSFGSEVHTHEIINCALNDCKTVYVPKITSKQIGMEIYRISSMSDLKPGYFGILEPLESCPTGDIKDIELIIMPGVAFDRQGGRVGYGAAFYDRFLFKMNRKIDKIALAYQLQVVDRVPMDESDVRIDGIITNEELIAVKP